MGVLNLRLRRRRRLPYLVHYGINIINTNYANERSREGSTRLLRTRPIRRHPMLSDLLQRLVFRLRRVTGVRVLPIHTLMVRNVCAPSDAAEGRAGAAQRRGTVEREP